MACCRTTPHRLDSSHRKLEPVIRPHGPISRPEHEFVVRDRRSVDALSSQKATRVIYCEVASRF